MRKICVFIGICIYIGAWLSSCSYRQKDVGAEAELDRLDKTLEEVHKYDRKKKDNLDSIGKLLAATSADDTRRRWELNMALGKQYLAFCSDSSAYYFNLAHKIAEGAGMETEDVDSRISLAYAQSAAGMFTLAFNSLNALDTVPMSVEYRILYAKVARQLFSYMDEYAKGYESEGMEYRKKGLEYEQYLIDHLPDSDRYGKFMYAQQSHRQGKDAQARKLAMEVLKTLPENTNLYGMTAYLMAQISRSEGNDAEYGRYLALASISDVKSSVKETMALPALAKWLYNKGEVDRAYRYINASLEDATESNARMRTVEIATLLPMVDDAYRKEVSSSRDELMLYLALVIVLFAVTGGLLAAMFRAMRRTSSINRKLAQQSKVQESYIGHFLGLCSSYSDKLDSMRRLVNRKIAAGQTEELLKMLKSGKYTDTENDDFFAIFDETFLDLYPTFLDELNALLKPECRITHKRGTPLSTEIRIYAFVRLGVEESVKIARILHCSVSTIYTYRNRMRGRAINRESFEKDVLGIGIR